MPELEPPVPELEPPVPELLPPVPALPELLPPAPPLPAQGVEPAPPAPIPPEHTLWQVGSPWVTHAHESAQVEQALQSPSPHPGLAAP